MTPQQAQSVVRVLNDAYGSRQSSGTLNVYTRFLADLDYEMAGQAAKSVIEEQTFFPAWAEFNAAYREQLAARRRDDEKAENDALLAEPSDEERQQQLERMKSFIENRWPKL